MHGSSDTMTTTSPTGYAFIAVAYTAIVLLAGSNLPTPLYPTYQRLFHLSPLTVTLVYATYAFTVMPSLAVFGPLSDAVGRRRVLLGAIAAASLAAVLFAIARGTAWLFVAQVVEGIAMGGLQGSAVAALLESHPRGDADRAALVGSSATVAGAAVGPLLAGVLAQYAPWPRRLPYVVEVVLLVVALVAVWKVYPHHAPVAGARSWRPRRPSVPHAIRRTFALAGTAAFLAWAVASLFLSLVPSYVIALLHTQNLAVIGGLAALMLASSAVVQLVSRGASALMSMAVGLAMVVGASGLLVAAAHIRLLAVIVAAAVLAGLGLGLAFRGSLQDVCGTVPADCKGDVMAALYFLVYLGTAVPVIGVGVVARYVGLLTAVQIFGYAIGGACVVGLAVLVAELRRQESS